MLRKAKKSLALLPGLLNGKKLFGSCPCCDRSTLFLSAGGTHFREDLRCMWCFSPERSRAVMRAIDENIKEWQNVKLHEASPYGALSKKLQASCKGYSSSNYLPDPKIQTQDHQDLQCLSFADESFDVFVSQDVFEHISDEIEALKEIHRVLKPGGSHIWTVPYYPSSLTMKCAEIKDGQVIHYKTPEYHGDPLDPDGALVFTRWGKDLVSIVDNAAQFNTHIIEIHDPKIGVVGDCSQIFISRKAN